MTFEDACKIVALKHKLGKKLVTGHMVKYFAEAAEIYAESKIEQLIENQKGNIQ